MKEKIKNATNIVIKMFNVFKKIALIIWQLPQLTLGTFLLFLLFTFNKVSDFEDFKQSKIFLIESGDLALSLGNIIIISEKMDNRKLRLHEWGHTIQSYMLGPLYLIVVGLPSVTFKRLGRLGILKRENYYKRFPENWADKLGNVDR